MAFIRNKSLFKQFHSIRTCTLWILSYRHKSLQALPKFPFPNLDSYRRVQPLKACTPSVYPGQDRLKCKLHDEDPPAPKKLVKFLRFDADNNGEDEADEDVDNRELCARIKKKVAVTDRPPESAPLSSPKKCIPELEAIYDANVPSYSTSSIKGPYSVDAHPHYLREQQQQQHREEPQQQHREEPQQQKQQNEQQQFEQQSEFYRYQNMKWSANNSKIQLDKMNSIREMKKKQQQNLQRVKVQQRIKKLMELQKMLEEAQPIPYTRQEPAQFQFVQSRNFRKLFPTNNEMRFPNPCKFTHPGYFNDYNNTVDWTTYTPCHVDSDNGDIVADPLKTFGKHLDQADNQVLRPPSNEPSKDSAIYKLCKGVVEISKNKY